ncbi:uncharacterized protein LOC107268927 isoform X2 [Cephus cinctus]|uniref:Uncharacterized protein LOC107268927 isoform X2 n=1 Tax=Cephus cinctus TaxID=211228 RepID=A0AAJ7FLH3_CEPCN|nr:uncharacterized protein LOC107268927 isoform X2 [Cephus cinctus]
MSRWWAQGSVEAVALGNFFINCCWRNVIRRLGRVSRQVQATRRTWHGPPNSLLEASLEHTCVWNQITYEEESNNLRLEPGNLLVEESNNEEQLMNKTRKMKC